MEPFVLPKSSLTGFNTERVDTRVAQLTYSVDMKSPLVEQHKLLVGQLVDVFIDARPADEQAPAKTTSEPVTTAAAGQ